MSNVNGKRVCLLWDHRRLWLLTLLSIFFLSLPSIAQTPTRTQLIGTWIGVHSQLDTDNFCPLPTYILLDPDSTYTLGMVDGSASAITSTWALDGDRVRLDTVHFAPKLITVDGDLLRIGSNYPMIFRRFTNIPLDSIATYRQLNGRVWQSDSLTVSFYPNGQIALENPHSRQRTAHYWRLARYGSSLFIVIQGNQYRREGNYKFLWQIGSQSSTQLQILGWHGHAIGSKTFRFLRTIVPGDSCRPNGFQTCDNCFTPLWGEAWIGRSSRRYDLTKLLTKQYKPVKRTDQSGLIHIQFIINCEGESGRFTMSSLGNDYCPKTFAPQITDQLLTICRNTIATDSSFRPDNKPGEQPTDTAISFTVRLRNGSITDILP